MTNREANTIYPIPFTYESSPPYDIVKRILDVSVSLVTMVILLPLFLVIAVAIWLESPGSALVSERRTGGLTGAKSRGSNSDVAVFQMYRFRTTYLPIEVAPRLPDDPRITRVGRFLQKTSLDELPQFMNVLKGEMTLVGPRPMPVDMMMGDYQEWHKQRLYAKPGIIGLWQVSRNHIGTLDEMAIIDIMYIQNRSLWLDIRIMLLAIPTLIRRSTYHHWLDAQDDVSPAQRSILYNLAKRLLDFVVAIIVLLLLSPILLVIAILIKLDSPGPVLFIQNRGGKRVMRSAQSGLYIQETSFRIYKFRTMHHRPSENDAAHQQWIKDWKSGKLGGDDPTQDVKSKAIGSRVTRVGNILRATSLDELPQIFNVIKGEMSLVGPRPVPLYEVAEYEDWHRQRLDAIPGMTGWWQISLRGRGTLDHMVELDMEYIRRRSLLLDLKIMVLTIPAVIFGRGAK